MEENIVKITFADLLDATKKFINGEMTMEEFNEWGQQLSIVSALPMLKKIELLSLITMQQEYSEVESQEIIVAELYRNLFFYLYLEGYLGIHIDLNDVNYANYDILEPIFGPWIEQYCLRDINIFKEMLKETLSLNTMVKITNSVDTVNTEQISEATKSTEEFINTLNNNRELINDLKDLMIMDNSVMGDIVKTIHEPTENA